MTARNEDTKVIDGRDKPRRSVDKYIWGVYITLAIVSLVELYSASSREVTEGHILTPLLRNAALLGVGCLIMIWLQRIPYRKFYNLTTLIVAGAVVLTILTMVFGQVINGARRSLSLGLFSLQSSELLKFSAALVIAKVLGDGQIKVNDRAEVSNRSLITVVIIVTLFGALLINQGLTNTLLLMGISLSMIAISGTRWSKFFMILGLYAVLGLGYVIYSNIKADNATTTEQIETDGPKDRSKLRKSRLEQYFASDKYKEPITAENQQEQYSYIAQANGGMFGVGPGNSREAARLPLAFSDYIYAIIIEDIGFVGGVGVMVLYLSLLARAGLIAGQCKKAFPALLIIGMSVFIVLQALFHMAIVTGVFPVSGQPLPFISKGGSSVIISSIALGMMLSVSRFAERKGIKNEADNNGDSSSQADNLSQL